MVVSDMGVYYDYAHSIHLANGGLPSEYYWIWKAPLYPYLMAASFLIIDSINFFVFLQIIVTSLTPVIIALIGRKLRNETCGIIAGFIAILSFDLVIYAVVLLTESIFVLMVSYIVLLLLKEESENWNWKNYSYLGVVFGLLILIKPLSILIMLCVVVFMFIRYFLSNWRNNKLNILIPLIFSSIMVISPWCLISSMHFNRFVFVCIRGYTDVWMGWHPENDGGYNQRIVDKYHPLPLKEPCWKEYLKQNSRMKQELSQFVRSHPKKVLEDRFRNLRRCFSVYSRDFSVHLVGLIPKNKMPLYTLEDMQKRNTYWFFACVLWSLECYSQWILTFSALIFLVDRKWIPVIIVLGTGLTMGFITHYEARYWIAARPAYILLSALTVTRIMEYLRGKKIEISKRRVCALGGVFFLFVLNEMMIFRGY
ncbi:MAG: hypothetical protein UT63_C0020G0025 [Candidatus Gottesmanbacteria bacterium GW2011_GWC2_39_8]|uniref:Glycosyltransferase RgtA/B/C/D-like domain-containing protein n=1 Tax=Candidatus Gottesmanbacteria bacterium GW2011_GWC2_39_8 TaxID=1618450 RepID=A0A0G0SEV8_9BACT|nr:MAG: hypothetical protein UT63_C0020G0025 [Candidatus Gottesmanbacteria bacterium GW2011_GWC2_39_8]